MKYFYCKWANPERKNRFSPFLVFFIFMLLLSGCFDDSRIYEKNVDFSGKYWDIDTVPEFEFIIQDTAKAYNIYWNVRNTVSYPFRNLYLTYYMEDTLGNQVSSNLHDMTLFDPVTGKPYGSGSGDIFDHQFLALPDQKFEKTGKYKIKLKQYMRMDSLPEVLSVGIRVEEAVPKEPGWKIQHEPPPGS